MSDSTEEATSPTPSTEKGKMSKDELKKQVEYWKNIATEKASKFKDVAKDQFGDTRVNLENYQQKIETYVREKPTKSVLIAVTTGFFIGLLSRRR